MEWLDFDEARQRKNARLIERFLNLKVDPKYPLTWRDTPVEHLDADRLRTIIEGIFGTNRTVIRSALLRVPATRLAFGLEMGAAISPPWSGTTSSPRRLNCSTARWS